MKISASAPGKLVLIGEYAVLEGAPAIVMAADRRAEALIETNMLDHNAVETSNADGKKGFFVIGSDGQLDWQDTQHGLISKLRLFSDILEYMLLRLGFDQEKIPSFTAHLMTTDFFRQNGMAEKKLGLGSSAALTVAFASAFASYIGEGFRLEDKGRWLKELLAAHRLFQKGVGSGLDVAASLYGGVISYVMGRGDDEHERAPELEVRQAEARRGRVFHGERGRVGLIALRQRWRKGLFEHQRVRVGQRRRLG